MSYSASAARASGAHVDGRRVAPSSSRPTVETEGVDQILYDDDGRLRQRRQPRPSTKLIRFPDQRGNKIGVDLSLLVPRADLKSRQLGEEVFYNVDVIGEVVKDDRLIDNFKYRFDIPTTEVGGEKIPLTVRRYLYPGEYKLDPEGLRRQPERRGARSPRRSRSPSSPTRRRRWKPPRASRGAWRSTKTEGGGPAAVGHLAHPDRQGDRDRPPALRDEDGRRGLGRRLLPERHEGHDEEAAALRRGPEPRAPAAQAGRSASWPTGPTGRAVGEDEYIVNEGREVFRVRILSPEKGAKATGPTVVTAAVAVPEGKALQKVEFYSNETRVATLYQPPWEQTINIRDTKSLGYVRVVGTLEDGTVAEDVRYVNAPSYISEVSVDAVELYTTVTDKSGRPVAGLQAVQLQGLRGRRRPEGRVLRVRQERAALARRHGRHVGLDARGAAGGAAGRHRVPRLLDRAEGPRVHDLLRQRALHPLQAHQPQGQALPVARGPARRGLDRALRRDRLRPLPVHGRQGEEGRRHPLRRQGHLLEVRLRHAARVRAQVRHRDLRDRA